MLRKLLIALAAVIAIGATLPTEASARWGGHWHGGWHRGWGWGGGFYPYAAYPYYGPYYGGCYRVRRVPTPWGWRWRRVWVC
ncbi:MAG TPA: sulfur globule protein precursor [Pseudolabrys sp.]|nr:sulfur globule protein precursor [Pseudolabrys sp.]